MKRVVFNCEVITPMFMVGADGRTPELRPSEFKGMMRFWWRAVKAEDDIKKLRIEEAKIFGGSGEVEEKSKICININPKKISLESCGKDIKDEFGEDKYQGLSYLFYSTYTLRSKGEPIIREYIKPNTNYDSFISLIDNQIFKKGVVSFWLSIYLDGFGTRARRGGRNIAVKNVNGDTARIDFIPDTTITTKEKIKDWLDKNLNIIKSIVVPQNTNKYSNLKNGRILIFDPRDSWKGALDFVVKQFKDFRVRNKSNIWNISAFGMPVMHKGFTIRIVPYEKDNKNKYNRISERRASPVIIKVIKAGNSYFPIIVALSGVIVLNGAVGKEISKKRGKEKIWIKAEPNNIKEVNNTKIKEFLDSLSKNAVEIKI